MRTDHFMWLAPTLRWTTHRRRRPSPPPARPLRLAPLHAAGCRDLWIMFVLKVLESYNYFSLSRSFTLYLTEEFGVGDYE